MTWDIFLITMFDALLHVVFLCVAFPNCAFFPRRYVDVVENPLASQVQYRMRHNSRSEHTVETSFRVVPSRLLAVTRVNTPSFPPLIRH